MNDTTKWIMIALLLLLIGAAVFMLLRSPGRGTRDEGLDRADGRTDALPGDRAEARRDRDVYDQESVSGADTGDVDLGEAARIGAMGAAGGGAVAAGAAGTDDVVADEPFVEERVADEPVAEGGDDNELWRQAATIGAGSAAGAGTVATASAYAAEDEAGREEPVYTDDAAFEDRAEDTTYAEPVHTEDAGDENQGTMQAEGEDHDAWRRAAAIGATGAAGAGVAAAASTDTGYDEPVQDSGYDGSTDVHPLSNEEIAAGASDQPLAADDQAAPGGGQEWVHEESTSTDEPLTADEVLASSDTTTYEGGDAVTYEGAGDTAYSTDTDTTGEVADLHSGSSDAADAYGTDEQQIGEETTYRAEDGQAHVVDPEPVGDTSYADDTTYGAEGDRLDTGYGDSVITDQAPATETAGDTGYPDAGHTGTEDTGYPDSGYGATAAAGAAAGGAALAGRDERTDGDDVDQRQFDQSYEREVGDQPYEREVGEQSYEREVTDEGMGAGTTEFAEAAYGPGSAEPAEDGSGPAGWAVKGNAGSMLFHTEESPSYDAVRAEVWFQDEETARNAGFAHWDRRRR